MQTQFISKDLRVWICTSNFIQVNGYFFLGVCEKNLKSESRQQIWIQMS